MIHEITAAVPAHKRSQRKGRGESSGRGKTSGRGNKGAKARTGTYIKRGHEGGQTPIFRRVPKRGFSNDNFETKYHVVNVSDLGGFEDGTTVDAAALIDAGLVPDERLPVKVLGDGSIGKQLTVQAAWYSRSAHQKITESGGAAQNLEGNAFVFPKPIPRPKPPAPVAATGGGNKASKKKKAAEEAGQATAGGEAAPAATVPDDLPAAEAPPTTSPADGTASDGATDNV